MSLRAADLIPEPCSEDWTAMAGGGASRFCARCRKTVHDLSGLDEAELNAVIERGESLCVRLRVDKHGVVLFPARTIVPVTRLRARAPAPATVALAVLAACTPHVRPDELPPEPVSIVAPREASVPLDTSGQYEPREDGFIGGGMLGRPGRPASRPPQLAGSVPCDTIAKTSHGRPTQLDAGRALLDDRELAKADLLARCDP